VEVETATLRALDKITGRSSDIEIEVGEPIVYGSLEVTMRTCYQTPPDERPVILSKARSVAVSTST
ncbi:MAG: DUF2155 domain-containing protein, partial [Pseudomonadota bacterium]